MVPAPVVEAFEYTWDLERMHLLLQPSTSALFVEGTYSRPCRFGTTILNSNVYESIMSISSKDVLLRIYWTEHRSYNPRYLEDDVVQILLLHKRRVLAGKVFRPSTPTRCPALAALRIRPFRQVGELSPEY